MPDGFESGYQPKKRFLTGPEAQALLGHDLLAHALLHAEGEGGLLFRPWGNSRRDLGQACERAGLPPVSPNDLRRTFGTWLRLHGVAPHFIGVAMGHADSRMVERVYGRMPEENLRSALNEHVDHVAHT